MFCRGEDWEKLRSHNGECCWLSLLKHPDPRVSFPTLVSAVVLRHEGFSHMFIS